MAEQDRPIMLIVGGSVSSDSNFFRVPNGLARSEQITTAYVGLSIEKHYAQQQFNLRITQGANRYKNFSYLDFDPLNFDGAWRWHLTPRVSGSLTFARTQSLASFEDTRLFGQSIVQSTGSGAFSLDGQLSGGWHLLAAIPLNSQINSNLFPQQQSYREAGIDLGIRYIASSGNSITLYQRTLRGKFVDRQLDVPNQLDTGYRNSVTELLAQWQVTGKSSLNGRLGWLVRDYDNFATRSFSGPVGDLSYTWNATNKVALSASAGRNLNYYESICSSYRVIDTVSLGSSWQSSAKTSLNASLNWSSQDYRGPLDICTLPAQADRTNGAQFGVNWAPLRNASIGASIVYQRRSSNYPGQTWDDTTAAVNASIQF
jgi:exopolysaccharide biosynthesis operon protein EpsL